jgi:hypothetical protein
MDAVHDHHHSRFATWQIVFLKLALVVSWVGIFFPVWREIFEQWLKFSEGLSHGLQVSSIFLYFLMKTPKVIENPKVTIMTLSL